MKVTGFLSGLALASTVAALPKYCPTTKFPTTNIAGIEVINTPIVKAAYELIRVFQQKQPYLYNHLMRSWLFGAAAINNNETLKYTVDLEVQAVGALLHDLGWDMRNNSPWVTQTAPFEVDGAAGAVQFVKDNQNIWTTEWDDIRQERLWDGITLQGMPTYLPGKNLDTNWIVNSVVFEFPGPRSPMITNAQYDSILAAYSNHYVYRGTNETFTYIAETKPNGTYNTFLEPFGTELVSGYSAIGHRTYDLIKEGYDMELGEYANETAITGSTLGPGAV